MMELEKVIKELRWLQFNFPWQDNPKNDADKMCNAIHKYTGDAIELLDSQQWVSVKDRLPDSRKWVLCRCRAEIYEVMRFNFNNDLTWYHDDGHEYLLGFVTHWMPLPEPPKED